MEQNAGFFLLLFSPLTPFKQINVAPLLSLLKDRQHIFWVDTGDLASFHNREEQVKSKTFWCHASREWMLAMYFCRASSLRLSMFRKRFVWRLPSKAYQPKGMLTCAISASSHHPPTGRSVQVGPHAHVWLHTFIISFCSRLLVSVLLKTILLYTVILLCVFTDCMSPWCEVYFLLGSTQDTNYSIWNSSLKGLLNSILVTCKEYGLTQKKMEVTGFLMGVR